MNKTKIQTLLCTAVTGAIALSTASAIEKANSAPDDSRQIKDITFVVFDTETTGWNSENGYVIELGAIKFRNGRVLSSKSWLIKPETPITASSQRIHGIDDSMVEHSPSFREVYSMFSAFSKNSILLAHNADYDVRMISYEIQRNHLPPITNQVLDTLSLARKWFPELKSHSITNLIQDLNIPSGKLHRALADCECTKDIFLSGLKKMNKNATLADLKALTKKVSSF